MKIIELIMYSSTRLLAAFVLIFAGSAVGILAQTGFSLQVNGQVRFAESRQPAPNVIVRLESNSGGMVGQVSTDRNGKFTFNGLRAEVYRVSIHYPGYTDVQESVDLMTASTGFVNAQLVPAPGQNNQSMPPSVLPAVPPPAAVAEYEKGKQLVDQGKESGIPHLEKAIDLYPGYLDAELSLGLAYMDQKQWDKAEKAFLTAININNNASTAYFALGEVYLNQKRFDDAVKTLQDGLGRNPGSGEGHATLAKVYWEMAPSEKDDAKFKADLQSSWMETKRALELKPSMPDAHLLAGNLLLKARRAEDALEHFRKYLELNPQGPAAKQVTAMVEKIQQALAQEKKKTN